MLALVHQAVCSWQPGLGSISLRGAVTSLTCQECADAFQEQTCDARRWILQRWLVCKSAGVSNRLAVGLLGHSRWILHALGSDGVSGRLDAAMSKASNSQGCSLD